MPKRYDSEFFPAREPPEQSVQLACAIHDVILKYSAQPRFEEMVRRWCGEYLSLVDAERDFEQRRAEHARRVQLDPRLQDQAAGPPDEGWRREALRLPSDAGAERPTPQLIGGWVPPELSSANWPEVRYPWPLPSAELTVPGKYAVLAAVHDSLSRGRKKINRWEERSDAPEAGAFANLVGRVKNDPGSDNTRADVRALLDDVEDDLREWSGAAPRHPDSEAPAGAKQPAESATPQGVTPTEPTGAESSSSHTNGLKPSHAKARALYEWAMEHIDGAEKMAYAELFDKLQNDPRCAGEGLPDNAEAFARYCRAAGIRRNTPRRAKGPTRSVRRQSDL